MTGFRPDDERIRDALEIAEREGLQYGFEKTKLGEEERVHPFDTMGEIGRDMDVRYRETAGGGLAATPTGRRLARERLVQIKKA